MLKFNGVGIPSCIKIKKINIQTIPEVNHFTKKIAGSNGVLMGRTTLGAKIIKAPFVIVPPSGKALQSCAREIAEWLMGDNWKLTQLIITDEPDLCYMAKINNGVEISDLLFAGEGELEFIVPSGTAQTVALNEQSGTQKATVFYTGTAEVLPEIELTFTADAPHSIATVSNSKTGVACSFVGAFAKGDIITISCKHSNIKVNGSINMKMLTLDSRFLNVVQGLQEIVCSIPQCLITVKYHTCWV